MMDGFNHQLVVIVPSCRAVITRLGATVDQLGYRTFRRRRDGEPAGLCGGNHDCREVSAS